eukprot:jgi/Ulvmu1/3274/UM151_0022.1
MSTGSRYPYGGYSATASASPYGSAATGPARGGSSYPAISPAGMYPPAVPSRYMPQRPAPHATPNTPWHHQRPYAPPPGQFPPARAPENMSSLTKYTLKVKEEFVFPEAVPAATIEHVPSITHDLSTAMEEEILADAEARLRAVSSSSASASAADSLLGDLSSVAIGSSQADHGALGGAGGAGANTLTVLAPAPLPPAVDAAQPALEVYSDMHIGTEISRRLALAKYPAEDQEAVEAFCRHFSKCKEVLHDKVSDLDIAAALYATDAENGNWQQSAMDLLIHGAS